MKRRPLLTIIVGASATRPKPTLREWAFLFFLACSSFEI